MTCSARCRAPAPNWRRGCCRNWGAIAIDSTLPKTCSVTVGPRRSVISPAQSIRSGFAARATRRSEPPSTCGPTAAGTPARGPRLTTRAFANGANPTHAPYDASANAGAKILWKMWQTRTRYDAELHQQNQLKHGSWVLKLQTA